MNWTDVAVGKVKTLWGEGLAASAVARELGRIGFSVTRSAVIGKVHRLKLAPRVISIPTTERKAGMVTRRKAPTQRFNGHVRILKAPKPKQHVDAFGFLSEATDLPPDQSEHALDIDGLKPRHCRWPLGDPSHDMLYCGDTKHPGHPYCARHCRLAYYPLRQNHRSRAA